MRTIPFRTVLEQVMALGGTPYSSATAEQLETAANAISLRFNMAYGFRPWPELMLVEERPFADAYFATNGYVPGNVVWNWATRLYYVCILATTGNDPTNATYWTQTARPTNAVIATQQFGQNKIATLWGAWQNDPRQSSRNHSFSWVLDPTGYWFTTGDVARWAPNTLWLVFTVPAQVWTTTPYDEAADYNRYDQVFSPTVETIFPDRGENYFLDLDTNGNPFWSMMQFPAIFSNYCAYGAAADLRMFQGNRDPAELAQMRARADEELWNEWDKCRPMMTALVSTRTL